MDIAELLSVFAEEDGALIEVLVGDVPAGSWPRVFAALVDAGYQVAVTDLERGAAVTFDAGLFQVPDSRYSVRIPVGRQVWTTTPQSADSLDLQGDPRDVRTPEDVADIIAIMRLLHDVTAKPVVLVAETLDYAAATPYLTVP
jgi:hypothetical protein